MIVRDIPASSVNFKPTRDWLMQHDAIEVYQCLLFAQGEEAEAMDNEFDGRNASWLRKFASVYGELFNYDAACTIKNPQELSFRICDDINCYSEKYKVLATTGDSYLFAIYRVGYFIINSN